MLLQDLFLTIGGFIFIIALYPTIKENKRLKTCTIPLKISLLNYIILVSYAVIYATMNLYLSSITMYVLANLWGYIALQRKKYHGDSLKTLFEEIRVLK